MYITLSPQRSDEILTLSLFGDILTINGESFDFSSVEEGNPLPCEDVGCDRVASDVERVGGDIRLSIIMPHGALPMGYIFDPDPITASDGVVTLPEVV